MNFAMRFREVATRMGPISKHWRRMRPRPMWLLCPAVAGQGYPRTKPLKLVDLGLICVVVRPDQFAKLAFPEELKTFAAQPPVQQKAGRFCDRIKQNRIGA